MNIDTREFDQLMKELQALPDKTVAKAGAYFKSVTPKRTGNARSKTRIKDKKIEANYAYAGRLDEGWSNQAPKGMTEPTLTYIEAELNRAIGRL